MRTVALRVFSLVPGLLLASACTTASFSPPRVDVQHSQVSPSRTGCSQTGSGEIIARDIAGATELTDRFIAAYRCAREEAVDGRQIFEVPSFLALVAGAIGPTYGLTDNGRIAALASSAVLGRANGYYAPKDKARYLDAALDAVLCIKTEAVDISFFDTSRADVAVIAQGRQAAPGAQLVAPDENALDPAVRQRLKLLRVRRDDMERRRKAAEAAIQSFPEGGSERAQAARTIDQAREEVMRIDAEALPLLQQMRGNANAGTGNRGSRQGLMLVQALPGGRTIEIDVKQQYFETVSAALLSVERILAQRFLDAGSFDAAGLVAEVQQVTATKQQKETDAKALASQFVAGLPDEAQRQERIRLDLQKLQPALQACVIRAKLGS